ncbi:LuxR C-terminal-related transcriptional regulator [Planobispora takensis]|nr:LuxR C-terminal-related transcriptional regulator [Planobispora takensis]
MVPRTLSDRRDAMVVNSKVVVPEQPPWTVCRTRIVERLRRGAGGSLTVVTGPPGAGKTSAVVSWATADRSPGPIAWVTLDPEDVQPETFWPLVAMALYHAGINVSWEAMDWGRAPGELALDVSAHGRPVILVLDNLHMSHNSEVSRGLTSLLESARPWLRLVVTARRDPALPLHRYRLAGQLTEVRVGHLAFAEREAEPLLAQHGVRLAPAPLRALVRRTEGWAAGLRLAAISLEGHPDPDGFVAQFAGDDKSVVAYLIEEVLDARPDDQRRLLLVTSVPDRVNSELAAELGGVDVGRSFAEVVQDNPFATQLDHGWYRYHPMFAEALRLILRHEAPGDVASLNLRAAAWFARKGLLLDAVRHAVRADDWAYASRLVIGRTAVGRLLGLRPDRLLVDALRGMPDHVTRTEAEPGLVAAAVARAGGDDASCARALRTATELIARLPAARALPARLAAGMIRLTDPGPDDAERVRAVTEVENLLRRLPARSLDDHPEVRALVLASRGRIELGEGRTAEAADAFGSALTFALETDGEFLRRHCLGHLALTECLRSRFVRATELAARAEQLPEVCPAPARRRVAAAHLASAAVALQHVELPRARHELARARVALEEFPDAVMSGMSALITAEVDLVEGLPRRALETVRGTVGGPAWLERRLTLAEADAHTLMGEPAAAREAAERVGEPGDPLSAVVLARAWIGAGDMVTAAKIVHEALAEPGAIPADVRVDAWLLDAYLSYRFTDPSRGRRSLDRALRLGDRDQLLLPFVRSRAWLQPLFRHDPDLVRPYLRLLELLRFQPGTVPASAESAVYGQLSARELDVLRHLSKMMTTEEIASQMYVSVNTVKTHLKSIYRKLAVTRRGEAVRRAKHLSLV